MSSQQVKATDRPIDPAHVARIAREVIARLQKIAPEVSAATISGPVVDLKTIERMTGTPAEIHVGATAIITPAACDEARRRGIAIRRTMTPTNNERTTKSNPSAEIVDHEKPERAEAVQTQLARRGIQCVGATVVLSETPAREVYHCVSRGGQRAAMITTFDDVDRFAAELAPTIWILDMKRMNLIAAVNVIARISKTGNQTR